jgi:hypothetical protein
MDAFDNCRVKTRTAVRQPSNNAVIVLPTLASSVVVCRLLPKAKVSKWTVQAVM